MDLTIAELLREPFPPESVGTKPSVTCHKCARRNLTCTDHEIAHCEECDRDITTAHVHVDFVGHAFVRERFLDVDPDWSWAPMALNTQGLPALDDSGGLWILLTLGGKTLPGYGDAPGNSGGNAVKEAIGDALRNAAMSFGVALELWQRTPAVPDQSADVPERQVERPAQTKAAEDADLRRQIAELGKSRDMDLGAVSADFRKFTKGTDLTRASAATLAEYKDHLQRVTA